MKRMLVLSVLILLLALSCTGRGDVTTYRTYADWFDTQIMNCKILINTMPTNSAVYIIDTYGEDFVGTTPYEFNGKATGVPYYFRIVKDGFYDYRREVRPTAQNPIVRVNIRLHPAPEDSFGNLIRKEDVDAPTKSTDAEVRNLLYGPKFVGESNSKTEGKISPSLKED